MTVAPRARDATEPALRGLFDHAGMFPPAQLPLGAALKDAAAFATTLKRPGLVGADLVIAWKDWPALDAAALRAAGFRGEPRVAVVGVALADGPAVAAALDKPGVRVVSLEVHADADLDAGALRRTAEAARGVQVYIEPKWPAARLAQHAGHVALTAKACGAGLKVRCAGPTALDRPALAAAVEAVAETGIPFKATQGLHHPVPRPGFEHGFLGLLAAVRLRQHLGKSWAPYVADCLAEPDTVAFDLGDGIAWHGEGVPAAALARLPPFAIGSCSLIEPDDDLAHAYGAP